MADSYSVGPYDGSQILRPVHADGTFQMLNMEKSIRTTIPIPHRGMAFGDGAVNNPPAGLESGVFLSLKNFTTGVGTGYGATDPYNTGGVSIAKGSKYYDVAPDAESGPIYMAFFPYGASTIGHQQYNLRNPDGSVTVVKNPNYDPGTFGTDGITGLRGIIKCWYPVSLLLDRTLTGYGPGTDITVTLGRAVKSSSGKTVVGEVETVDTASNLVLIHFNIVSGNRKTA